MQRIVKRYFIPYLHCRLYVRRPVRSVKNFCDHRTDMRKSFDGLMAIIRDVYELDPYANAVYLFCGKDSRKLKALHFDKDGFVLLQKRLDGSGRFQWPRNASEARLLTRQEFRWLMEGLSIDQPKAIKSTGKKKDF